MRHASSISASQAVEGGEGHRVHELELLSVRWNFADDSGTQSVRHRRPIKVYTATFNAQVFADTMRHSSVDRADISKLAKLEDEGGDQGTFARNSIPGPRTTVTTATYLPVCRGRTKTADSDGVSVPANPFSGTCHRRTEPSYLFDFANVTSEGLESGYRVNPEPDIESISITSTPEQSTGYMPGEAIIVTVKFFEEVEIGEPQP